MFCPVCKCEFRVGFTRCESCNTDLVDDLAAAEESAPRPADPAKPMLIRMAEYCGFLDLDEARQARDTLRRERIASDILIREAPGGRPDGPVEKEEYWLRVEASRFPQAAPILGFDQVDPSDDETLTSGCPVCGYQVPAEEPFCPGCGNRFERG